MFTTFSSYIDEPRVYPLSNDVIVQDKKRFVEELGLKRMKKSEKCYFTE